MSKIYVVGIGPGKHENMTPRAQQALENCDIIVGYTVYVGLVKEHYADKEFLTTPMRREVSAAFWPLSVRRKAKPLQSSAAVTPAFTA